MRTKIFLSVAVALVFLCQAAPAAADPVLGCFIDTPAYDYPTQGSCYGPGSSTNSAAFVVMGVNWDPAVWSVSWVKSCDQGASWDWCAQTIYQNQCKTQTAHVTHIPTGQVYTTSATACRESAW